MGRDWDDLAVLDRETGELWIRAVPQGELTVDPDDPRYHAYRASYRRSFRSLQTRGLVECRMMRALVPQRDPDKYDVFYDAVRAVLVARTTQAGRDLIAEIGQ